MSNFFFCHYVFKKPSAAEASENVYMRERDMAYYLIQVLTANCFVLQIIVHVTEMSDLGPSWNSCLLNNTLSHIQTLLQQITIESILAKGDIAHND